MQNGTHRGRKNQVLYRVQLGPEETPQRLVRQDWGLVVQAGTAAVGYHSGCSVSCVWTHTHTHTVLRYRHSPPLLVFLLCLSHSKVKQPNQIWMKRSAVSVAVARKSTHGHHTSWLEGALSGSIRGLFQRHRALTADPGGGGGVKLVCLGGGGEADKKSSIRMTS